jgi:acyl carrier protein
MRAVALDRHGGPVPPGAVGELVVAGPQLARGYHDDPGLTAARFTAFPAAGVERGYRTGDLVRLRRDGELVFLGRADDQINLHGHRVEPGEIEAALRTRPGVREAAVVLRDDLPGPPRLVAYATGEGAADEAGLWAALRRGLPGHLVPSALVVLDALPLTAHGKLDRTALPPPAEPGDAPGDRPPDTAAEELVAEVVAPLLGRDAVGADADFFALGGNSLLAVRVAAGVRDAVGVDLPVRAVFTFPTVAALAQEVERLLTEEIDRLDDDEVHAVLTEGGTR